MASWSSALVYGVLVSLLAVYVDSTAVKNCQGNVHGERMQVDISSCEKAPCILKKNTTAEIMIRFKPQHEVKELRNRVFAKLAGVPLPFLGVDGKLSCKNVFEADGETAAGCPITPDKEYVYKNSFEILPFYPTVNPLVHWGLQDADNFKYIVCFEIQAKIVH